MSSINRVFGLASGMDIDQMVSDLMRAHRMPLNKLEQDKQIWQWKQEDYRTIKSDLLNLRNDVFDLKLQGTFQVKTAVSGNENIVTVAAGSSAVAGTYQVEVTQLATIATKISSGAVAKDGFDPSDTLVAQQANLTQGTDLNFGWGEDHVFSFTINGETFSFDGDSDSLNAVIAEVNASEAGVSMFYDEVTQKVVISTTQTGNNNTSGDEIQITDVTGSFMGTVLQFEGVVEQGGTDAQIKLNGLETTRSSNTFTVNGTTFNLTGETPAGGAATTVNVAYDTDNAVSVIKNFVAVYNETIETIYSELNEERYADYKPLTNEEIEEGKLTDRQIDTWEEKARSGLLKGDTLLGGVAGSMRSVLASIIQGINKEVTITNNAQEFTVAANQLSIIGITTGTYEEHGKLYLDEDRLREALESNPDAVMEMFTRTCDEEGNEITENSQKGLAVRLYEAINSAVSSLETKAGSAGSLYDNSFIGNNVREIDERIMIAEERLLMLEDRYYRQFTAMEQAIANMNSQSMWLAQQLGAYSQ